MNILKLIPKMLLFAALVATWSSCSKSDDLDPKDQPAEKDPYMTVCEHVCDVADKVVKYYEASKSIAEMAQYIDDIKQIDYVEDVYNTNTTMFVRVKDFGVISYSYFPKEKPLTALKQVRMKKTSSTRTGTDEETDHPLLGFENAVVVNQQTKDESREFVKTIASNTLEILNNSGLDAKPNNSPDIEFFKDGIFDYDIVFLITHGMWDPKERLHWLLTSVEPTAEEVNIYNSRLDKDKLYRFREIDRDQLSIAFVDETRNGKEKSVAYFRVSEKYLKESSKSFKKDGKVIFFNTACQSLMDGNNEEDHEDHNLSSPSLADILEEKGVGAYLGYDESNGLGKYAGFFFFMKLAEGMSIERAYETLPEQCLHDEREMKYWAGLRSYTYVADLLLKENSKNSAIKNSCFISPQIEEVKDYSDENGISFEFKGHSWIYRAIDYYIAEEYEEGGTFEGYKDYDDFRYGFEVSESMDFTNPIQVEAEGDSYTNNKLYYSATLTEKNLKYGTTYYYRGVFYDGKEFYYSYTDSGKFTTKTFNSNGTTTVPDVTGSDF